MDGEGMNLISALELRDYRRIALFALPLALSGIAMNGESPVVNAGVSRLADPELGLAGFGVAMSVAWLIESPIVMMLDAATARAADRRSFSIIRQYALIWCVFLTMIGGIVAFTPVSEIVFGRLLGVSQEVGAAARVGMAIFLPWPLAIAWRRMHQGILIRHSLTRVIGYAVAVRLVTVSVVVSVGVTLGVMSGTALGAMALVTGVCVEATIVWLVARRIIRLKLPEVAPPGERPVESMREFHRYYLPLAGTMLCFFLASPVVTAGLARGASPTVSLAAWPVAYSLIMLIASPLNGMQQVSVRLGAQRDTAQVTRRFLLGCGIALSALLVVLNASGGTRWLMETAIGAPADIVSPAFTLAWILTPLPMLTALRSLWRGILIAGGRTSSVQIAILLNLIVLTSIVLGLARFIDVRGYLIGGMALVLATMVETAFLTSRALRNLAPLPDSAPVASPS
jgi:progressive ankylosis protein